MTSKVDYELADNVATLRLADPATLNALTAEVVEELRALLRRAVSEARAVLICGAGRGFCSGWNLSTTGPAMPEGGPFDGGLALEAHVNPFMRELRDLPIPVVSAVHGAAAGVGASIALAADLIVAGESAYFLQAFRRIGLIPDGGSTWLLPRMIGRARAMEMTLLGERLPAAKALEWGLINRCVPDAELMPTALAIAHELAKGPASLGLIRKAMWASLDADFADQLAFEAVTQNKAGATADFAEGVAAFLQKRPAAFTGR